MDAPQTTFLPDQHRYVFHEGVTITLERFRDASDGGVACEMHVRIDAFPLPPGHVLSTRINLMSASAKEQLRRQLEKRNPHDDIDWYEVIERVAVLAVRRWREGAPIVTLADVPMRERERFLLPPFWDAEGVSLLFADGGVGKSLLALAMGLSVASSAQTVGVYPTQVGPVLYLDWETEEDTMADRLWAINSGAGVPTDEEGLRQVRYMRMEASLLQMGPDVRKRLQEIGAVAAIVDSLGAARGADPADAGTTIQMFNAMRAWGVPVLAIDHVTKDDADQDGPYRRRPKHSYGSVFTRNRARLSWRIDTHDDEEEDDHTQRRLALVNVKANNARFHPRVGFLVEFLNDEQQQLISVQYRRADVGNLFPPESGALTVRERILRVLVAGPLTTGEIVAALAEDGGAEKSRGSISANLVKASRRNLITQIGDSWALVERLRTPPEG